jgi:hypothetical protein
MQFITVGQAGPRGYRACQANGRAGYTLTTGQGDWRMMA